MEIKIDEAIAARLDEVIDDCVDLAGDLAGQYFQEAFTKKAFDGICNTYLSEKDGELQLGGICLVAGLGNKEMREGTFDYYMREPIVQNDAKGVAPLVLAYVEVLYRQAQN